MLKIHVENTHNHLITSQKYSSEPSEHPLFVLRVHLLVRRTDGLVVDLAELLAVSSFFCTAMTA